MTDEEIDQRIASLAAKIVDQITVLEAELEVSTRTGTEIFMKALAVALIYAEPRYAKPLGEALSSPDMAAHYPLAEVNANHATRRQDEQWQVRWRNDAKRDPDGTPKTKT